MPVPSSSNRVFAVCAAALARCALSQSCVTDFDCTSISAPACVSNVCSAGPTACTGDDAGENADDGPAGARALDPVPGVAASMTAAICGVPADESDYYKTTIEGRVPLTVTLSWSGADSLELAAFDATGTPLGSSQGSSPQTATLTGLPDGTYYLRVKDTTAGGGVDAKPYAIQVTRAGDLLAHNGFETCWSHASTVADFENLLTNSAEGVVACIPPAPNATPATCATINGTPPTCPGGIPGCPVTLRAKGPSIVENGPLVAKGVDGFGSIVGVDSFSMPIIVQGADCTATITNSDPTSLQAISIQYLIDFNAAPDANGGGYIASVNPISSVVVNNLMSSQVAISGSSFFCSSSFVPLSSLSAALASAIPAAMPDAQVGVTVGDSICPLQ